MVADIEEKEEMDASELHVRRFNAKEVLTPLRSANSICTRSKMEQSKSLGRESV